MRRLAGMMAVLMILLCAASAASADVASGEAPDMAAVLDALGEGPWHATREALQSGETIGNGARGEAARGLQMTLIALGQDIDADGSVGPKTLSALNAVQEAFAMSPTENLDATGYDALLIRQLIASDAEAARGILLPDMPEGEFEYARACALLLAGERYSARTAFLESGWGDFQLRADACAEPWPANGLMWKNDALGSGNMSLTLRLIGEPGTAMFVKVGTAWGDPAAILFVEAGREATVRLPAGVYTVSDATGEAWFGEANAFGDEGRYERLTFDGGVDSVELESGFAYTITVNVDQIAENALQVGTQPMTAAEF